MRAIGILMAVVGLVGLVVVVRRSADQRTQDGFDYIDRNIAIATWAGRSLWTWSVFACPVLSE